MPGTGPRPASGVKAPVAVGNGHAAAAPPRIAPPASSAAAHSPAPPPPPVQAPRDAFEPPCEPLASPPADPAPHGEPRRAASRRTATPVRRKAGWFGSIVQLCLIAGIGAGGYYAYTHNLLSKEAIERLVRHGDPPAPPAKRVTPVLTAMVRRGEMDLSLNGLGSVTALYTVTLHSRVDGELQKVHFVEGQMVKQGDLLAEIDPRPFQVQLEQAEGNLMRDQAGLKVNRLDLERYNVMIASKSITQQQLDGQKALVQQSEGAIKTDVGMIDNANLQLHYCRIVAPVPGRIGLRMVDPGNIVRAGDFMGLAVITQLQPITVVFTIPQDDIARVQRRINSGAELLVDAYDRDMTTRLATGKLMALDNQVDVTTGTVKLKAVFANEDNMLFPNQFVNARLRLDVRRDAIIAPTAAVQRGPDSTFTYVVQRDPKDPKAEKVALRQVAVGPTEGDECVIERGLQAGDVVVIDGVDKLQPGAAVVSRDRNAPPPGDKVKPAREIAGAESAVAPPTAATAVSGAVTPEAREGESAAADDRVGERQGARRAE